MSIFTIEYQMGCGGRAIGRILADRLQYTYIDREIVQGVAHDLHVDEATADLHDERVAGVLGRVIDVLRVSGELTWMGAEPDVAAVDPTTYHATTCHVIETAARRGNVVIVGHASTFALAGWPNAVHVGLYAPRDQRVATVMDRLHVARPEALRRVNESDQGRARYVRRFYNAHWLDAEHYHLMIDTEWYQPEQVADLIMTAWQARTRQSGSPAR